MARYLANLTHKLQQYSLISIRRFNRREFRRYIDGTQPQTCDLQRVVQYLSISHTRLSFSDIALSLSCSAFFMESKCATTWGPRASRNDVSPSSASRLRSIVVGSFMPMPRSALSAPEREAGLPCTTVRAESLRHTGNATYSDSLSKSSPSHLRDLASQHAELRTKKSTYFPYHQDT